MLNRRNLTIAALAAGCLLPSASVNAATCVGACGSSTMADGVVSVAPGGAGYQWISTVGGTADGGAIAGAGDQDGGGLGGAEANATGSTYVSSTFTALAGDILQFDFNYVTSDGGDYTDYAWAELRTSVGEHVAWLFTARTSPTGNTSPGFGLPTNAATLNPSASPIIPDGTAIAGGPQWSALGTYSGTCYELGCGHTGWINSSYMIESGGSYQLVLGVQNWNDEYFGSGLAFASARIGNVDIGSGGSEDVPLPASALLLVSALAGIGGISRLKKHAA